MKTDLLLKKFDVVTQGVDGVSKLRQTILQMAVQGNLSQQSVNDEPAIALLRAINKDKGSAEKYEEKIGPDPLPSGWSWAYISDVSMRVQYGFNASAQETGKAKLLRITDIQNNKVNWATVPL